MPLSDVTVTFPSPGLSTSTNEIGAYTVKVPTGKQQIIISLIGYVTIKGIMIVGDGEKNITSFKMMPDVKIMDDVIVKGVKVQSAAATRMLTPIEDIPQAIAVIGQKVIQEQAVIDLTTITRNISGLNFTGNYSGAGSYQFFNARGFDLNDSQSYRWNGAMVWNLGNNYWDNIEQVEFLKGPNSILFGDVAPGGVMNFVTKKPLADFGMDVNFKTGSWNLFRPSIDVTGPVTKDRKIRFRLNTSYETSNSFRNQVSSKKEFIAPTVAWDINTKLSLSVEAVFKKSAATDDAGLVSPDGTLAGLKTLSPSLYLGDPSHKYLYSEQDYFANLSYSLNKNWAIKTLGFYGNTDNRPFGIWFDPPDSSGNFARREYGYHQNSKTNTISLSINGTFYTGSIKHSVVAGIDCQSTNYRYTNDGSLYLLDTSNVFHPIHETSTKEPANSPYLPYVSTIARTGIFAQDQLMFLKEKLHILLGLRAGRTRQGNHYFQNELAGTQFEGFTDDFISKNVVTPRVGLVYKLKDWWSLYTSYSKGYEINSPDIFAHNYLQYTNPPATLSSQIEFGFKSNFLNNKLGVTLSVFQIDKHNPYGYVYLDPVHPDYDDYDVYYQGHHRSQGIELDADGKITSALSITAGAAYTKTSIMDDPGYPTGNVLPNAPKYTGNIWLNYDPKVELKGFSFGTGLFYKASFFSSLANNPKLEIPPGYTWDVAIGYTYRNYNLQLNAMNLTNQVSYLNPWQFNMFDVKPLRQFILTMNYKFK